MARPATEHCNPCDNAEMAGRPHLHLYPDYCGRSMYRGDFYCACRSQTAEVRRRTILRA
jgi:hypothetical protein